MRYSRNDFQREAVELADELYAGYGKGSLRLARFHLSIQILLHKYQLNDEEIMEQVLDDHHDQGIDYFQAFQGIDNEIVIIQVKDNKTFPRNDQLSATRKMIGEFRTFCGKNQINSRWPERRKHRFREQKAMREVDHKVRFVLILTGGASAKEFTEDVAGLQKNESLEVFDQDRLAAFERLNLEPIAPDVTLRLSPGQFFEVDEGADIRTLVTMTNGLDYVEATEKHHTGIFRLNPRLYLGDRPSNKGMMNTLKNPLERRRFHLLNNGVTVVCKSYSVNLDSVAAKDFQVVNGCQTTETLWKFYLEDAEALMEVFVPLRIIQTRGDETLAFRISETTNSQSAVLSSDLVANDPCQKKIKQLLAEGDCPIFYEARRGELRQLKAKRIERNKFMIRPEDWAQENAQGFREIGLKEMAQVLLAVTQSPSSAKEQISSLFGSRGEGSLYQKLFETSWSNEVQLRLLVETYLFICREENWVPKGRNEGDKRELADLARLGRFYITYLTFRQWRSDFGQEYKPEDDPLLLPPAASKTILNDFVSTIEDLPRIACQALLRVKRKEKIETRQLLRRKIYRERIEREFDLLLDAKKI